MLRNNAVVIVEWIVNIFFNILGALAIFLGSQDTFYVFAFSLTKNGTTDFFEILPAFLSLRN